MEDLSLYILDLVQNSIAASADLIKISVLEDVKNDRLIISIKDNGRGMEPKVVDRATDPFYTTRTTRRVGLGLPFIEAAAQACGGGISVSSQLGEGTEVKISFKHSHIDRPPLGRIEHTITVLVASNPSVDFVYVHTTPLGRLQFDTKEIRQRIGALPIEHPDVIDWICSYIGEGLNEICGGGRI